MIDLFSALVGYALGVASMGLISMVLFLMFEGRKLLPPPPPPNETQKEKLVEARRIDGKIIRNFEKIMSE